MEPRPILPSVIDIERRRLESTIDQDLHSLSLNSLTNSGTHSHSHSITSFSSIEYPRGTTVGPYGAPRAMDRNSSAGTGESPVSTAGHHFSAVTLADGVFHRRGARDEEEDHDDWDPERSLGRLVGELGKVMSDVRFSS